MKWYFNPTLAPHFGGAHESMIKAAIRAISAALENSDITGEELITAVTGAESLKNSRPLTHQSANPDDDISIKPNHFLHGTIEEEFFTGFSRQRGFSPKKKMDKNFCTPYLEKIYQEGNSRLRDCWRYLLGQMDELEKRKSKMEMHH